MSRLNSDMQVFEPMVKLVMIVTDPLVILHFNLMRCFSKLLSLIKTKFGPALIGFNWELIIVQLYKLSS